MDKAKKLLRLYGLYARMDLAWLLRDTRTAVLAVVTDAVLSVSGMIGVYLLAERFGGVGGLSADEVLFMAACATMVRGLYEMFFSSFNTGHISRRIGRGQLEHMLIQPVPFPMQLMAEGFIPFTGSGTLISGIVLCCIAVARLGIAVSPGWLGALVLLLAISVLLVVAYLYVFSSAAFYAPVAAEEIATYAYGLLTELSTFPLSGLPGWLVAPLLTAAPTGLLAWFPAMVLLGKGTMGFPTVYPAVLLLILGLLATAFFQKGLKHYVKQGSNRYTAFGHRR